MPPVTGIILTGGNSSRMGKDKAVLDLGSGLMLEHIIRNLSKVTSEILIVGERPEYEVFGFPVIKDEMEGIGPLGGMYTGMIYARNEDLFIMPSDMPLLSSQTIQHILNIKSSADAVIPVLSGKHQLLSAYYKKQVGDRLEKIIKSGTRKVSLFVNDLEIYDFKVPNEMAHEFMNVNTQEDFDKLKSLL